MQQFWLQNSFSPYSVCTSFAEGFLPCRESKIVILAKLSSGL